MAAARHSDRISGLPDEIILKILSLLPDSRLAFQTSVLSTRWRRLPSHISTVRLPFLHDGDDTTKRYMRAVDGCLRALRAPTLYYLQIEIPDNPNADTAADEWIQIAGEHSVRELHLSSVSYRGTCSNGGPYSPCISPCTIVYVKSIPSSIFSSSISLSLTSLYVKDCSFRAVPKSFQGFSHLIELIISSSYTTGQVLAQLLQYCPVLESLQLSPFSDCDVLRLDPARVPKLKHLRIVKPRSEKPNVMVVEAPGLRSLSVEVCFEDVVLKDCPLLADVEIYGVLRDYVKYHSEISLLSSVSMVDRISVVDWIFQVEFVRKRPPGNSVPVFMNLKKLCCNVDCVTDSMLGAFPSILEECPSLVELHVKIKEHEKAFQSDLHKQVAEYWHSHQSWLNVSSEVTSNKLNPFDDLEQDGRGSSELIKGTRKSSHQLKYAVVQGFLGTKSEARLLQLLLRHATSLEKLVVIGFDFQFYDQTMVQKLLFHFRQGCPQVQITQRFQKLLSDPIRHEALC